MNGLATLKGRKSDALSLFERLEVEGRVATPPRNGVAYGIQTLETEGQMRLLYRGYQEWLVANSTDPDVRANPGSTAKEWMLFFSKHTPMHERQYFGDFSEVFGAN